MRNLVYLILLLGALAATSFLLVKEFQMKDLKEPVKSPLFLRATPFAPKLKISAWIPRWEEKRALNSLSNAKGKLGVILPVWYGLDEEGKVFEIPSNFKPEIRSFAKETNIIILPSISNAEALGFDPERVSLLINNEELTKREFVKLVGLAKTNGYSGWDLDLEEIYEKDREAYSEFVEKLANALSAEGLLLSVTVHAHEGTPYDWSGTKGQDLKKLSQSADFIRIMAYDFNNAETDPGPITPIDKLESTLAYATKVIPTHKIVLGLPTYGYDWGEKGGKAIQYEDAINVLKKYNTKGTRDKKSFALMGSYVEKGVRHTLWFEDAESLKRKIEIALKYGVYQFSLWHLGGEDEKIWEKPLNI